MLTIGDSKAIATDDVRVVLRAIVDKLVGGNTEFLNLWCWSYQANLSDEDELSHAELVWYECQLHNALFALKYRFIPFEPSMSFVNAPQLSLYAMYDMYVGAPSIRRSRVQKYLWDENDEYVDAVHIETLIRSLPKFQIWEPLIETPCPRAETPSSGTPRAGTPASRKRRARSGS